MPFKRFSQLSYDPTGLRVGACGSSGKSRSGKPELLPAKQHVQRQSRTFKLYPRPRKVAGPEFGGARRNRTADLLNAIQALSQLSYGPI